MENGGSEFILVQLSSPVSYKSSQDRLHSDDFDMTLIIYNLCSPYKPTDKVLHLKYYIILTSKGDEAYPTLEDEPILGKFLKIVSTGAPLALGQVDIVLPKSELNDDVEGTGSFGENDDKPLHLSSEDRPPRNNVKTKAGIMKKKFYDLGYYLPHDESMLQLMMDKSKIIQTNIQDMVSKGKCSDMTFFFKSKITNFI